jgi:hypothetical protein
MKHFIYAFTLCFLILCTSLKGQMLSTSNEPSQIATGSRIASGPSVYGVFAGRTPCQEFMREVKLAIRPECIKRKMGVTFYQDPVTHEPTTYETYGMDKRTGKGKWHIIKGMPGDPQATVFKLDLDAENFLFLLKGDDNVLFILDRNKHYLVGNGSFSYTFNRVRN